MDALCYKANYMYIKGCTLELGMSSECGVKIGRKYQMTLVDIMEAFAMHSLQKAQHSGHVNIVQTTIVNLIGGRDIGKAE